ncbi:MAG: DegV family protein, partial [Nitrospinae bacterium]|nr:DegV family protein [Nitrospinota bacterium]
ASAFGTRRMMEKLVTIIERESEKPGFEGKYALAWSDNPTARDEMISRLKERLGAENILTGRVSPVIGSHTGPGALGVICC